MKRRSYMNISYELINSFYIEKKHGCHIKSVKLDQYISKHLHVLFNNVQAL